MPHIWVEYSSNLLPEINVDSMLETVQAAAIGDGDVFPLAGARTRGIPINQYRIVDGNPDNAFVYVLLRIAAGRDVSAKQAAGQRILEALQDYLAPITANRPMGISVQLQEVADTLNFKTSNYRDYLANKSR